MPSRNSTLRILRALAVAAAGAALLWHRDARACSVCLAGDPTFSAQGTASQPAGSVSAYFEVRGWTKESGSVVEDTNPDPGDDGDADSAEPDHDEDGHEHGASTREHNDSQRLDLYVAWTPVDRVTVTLGVPWAFNEVEETDSEGKSRISLSGLGDASLGASGVIWRNRDVLPTTWIELRGWVKAPTGRSSKQVDGVLDPHVQPGTGSWDGGAGAALVHRFDWGSLYASSFYRINTEGGLDYTYGDVVLATVALEAPLGHLLGQPALDRVTPGFGFDFRYAQRDESGGETVADTGGAVLYATPSLRVALPAFRETQRAWLRAGVQIPLTDSWLYGEQSEGVVWSAGIGYGF